MYRHAVIRDVPNGRILIVGAGDGEVARYFESRGWNVLESPSVRTAIDAALFSQPDVVVASLVLPDVTGYTFVRSFRSVVDHDLVVIGLADARSPTGETAGAGFDAIFEGPLDLPALEVAACRAAQR